MVQNQTQQEIAEPVAAKNLKLGGWYYNYVLSRLQVIEISPAGAVRFYNPEAKHRAWYTSDELSDYYFQTKRDRINHFYDMVTKQAEGL